jgi:hypothetical protein
MENHIKLTGIWQNAEALTSTLQLIATFFMTIHAIMIAASS